MILPQTPMMQKPVKRPVLDKRRQEKGDTDDTHHRRNLITTSYNYADRTQIALQGVSAQLIAKIKGHAKLDYILYYTQKQKAEQILESLMS